MKELIEDICCNRCIRSIEHILEDEILQCIETHLMQVDDDDHWHLLDAIDRGMLNQYVMTLEFNATLQRYDL